MKCFSYFYLNIRTSPSTKLCFFIRLIMGKVENDKFCQVFGDI